MFACPRREAGDQSAWLARTIELEEGRKAVDSLLSLSLGLNLRLLGLLSFHRLDG